MKGCSSESIECILKCFFLTGSQTAGALINTIFKVDVVWIAL